jgi:FAD/FMN-containing dehydrogenase
VPKSREDAAAAIAIAREEGVPVLPRGGGTSQCGQIVARALVIDCSKYLDRVISVDVEARRARVEPGVVLDRLNRLLRKDKMFFPVDPSTASRATIGGMTAINSMRLIATSFAAYARASLARGYETQSRGYRHGQ